MRMTTNVLETVIEETKPFSIKLRRRSMYSCFISITPLQGNTHHISPKGLTAYLQRPCCLQVLYHFPAKRSIPFVKAILNSAIAFIPFDLPLHGKYNKLSGFMPTQFFVAVTRTGARIQAGDAIAPQNAVNDALFRRCAPYAHGAPRRCVSCAFHPQIPFCFLFLSKQKARQSGLFVWV